MDKRAQFEGLYLRHAPLVKAYVLRRADASVADDVVSEVFLVCWRRLDQAPPDALPWLLAIARRVLSTQRRGDRRRVALSQRLGDNAGVAGAPPQVGSGALRAALASMSQSDRELLLLIAWDDLSPAQAAAALGIKATTLRVRLLRARRRLERALADERSSFNGSSIPQPSESPQ